MKHDDRAEIIDRAIKALAAPELRDAKSARAIEELLGGARRSGDVPLGRLHQLVDDLLTETGAVKYLGADAPKATAESGHEEFSFMFALLMLLILLLLLSTRIDPSSDGAALLDEIIQTLLDRLKRGGRR